jgi:hypothetical protein
LSPLVVVVDAGAATQLGALGLGCIVNFDNHALGELELVPNTCLTFDSKSAATGGEKDEAGFDEL